MTRPSHRRHIRGGLRVRRGSLAVLFALVSACGQAADQAESAAGGSDDRFSGQFDTLAGDRFDLADLAGQDVVLWFWAPW